jgi:tetratricopeptide (TPR) repeat protein
LGDPGAALGPLTSAVERARDIASGSAILGRLLLDLGETHLAGGRFEQAGELLLEAGRLLESVGDRSQAARAACSLSHVHRERGEPEHALSSLEHARRLLEDAGDEVALARLSLDRGIVLAHLSRSLEASEVLDAAIAAHRRLGLVPGEIRARDWRVLALLGLGRDEEALLEAREIQQLALILDRPSYEAERAFGATWLVSGELAAADEAFGRALSILSLGGKEAVRGHVLSVRALARMLMGRLPEAEADLVACTQIHELRGSRAAQAISRAELTLVHALMNADEGEAAEAHLALAERGLGSPWEKRVARGRRAVLAIARARHAGASGAAIAALHRKARAELLEGARAPSDYFTRCTLLLLDHVASG